MLRSKQHKSIYRLARYRLQARYCLVRRVDMDLCEHLEQTAEAVSYICAASSLRISLKIMLRHAHRIDHGGDIHGHPSPRARSVLAVDAATRQSGREDQAAG